MTYGAAINISNSFVGLRKPAAGSIVSPYSWDVRAAGENGRHDAEKKTRRRGDAEKRRGGEEERGRNGRSVAGHVCCSDGRSAGIGTGDGRVWGTYLHGVFDADEFRRWFIDRLRVRRGLAAIGKVCARYDIEPAIDRLADAVRASLDMKKIYELMGL